MNIAQVETQSENASKYIKDYDLHESTYTNKKRILLTTQEVRQKHPFEYIVHKQREEQDIFKLIQPNQLLGVNLSPDVTAAQLKSIFCPNKERLTHFRLIADTNNRPAYCIATYYTSKEADGVKKKLKNYWIGYHLLKVRSQEDKDEEHFDNRTMVVRNIPTDMTQEKIYEFFSDQGWQILNIELPQEDAYMAQQLLNDNPRDEFQRERQQQQDQDFIKAKRIMKDAEMLEQMLENEDPNNLDPIQMASSVNGENINPAKELQEELKSYRYNEQKARQIMLSNSSLMKTVMRLQSEHVEVQNSQAQLQEYKQQLEHELMNPLGYSEIPLGLQSSNEQIGKDIKDDQLTQERSQVLQKVFKYLKQNPESVDESLKEYLEIPSIQKLGSDSKDEALHQLQYISKKELALVYDYILKSLEDRIQLIQIRLKKSIEHFGLDERLIYQVKDWNKELEEVPDEQILDDEGDVLRAEDMLSVNEQIQAVRHIKDKTPEERFYDLVSGTYNPFDTQNFHHKSRQRSMNPKMDHERIFWLPKKTMPLSVVRILGEHQNWKKEFQQEFNELLAELKGKMDMPFDELYHKEKTLIKNVILAQKALEEKEASVPNPLADRMFTPQQAIKDGEISDSDYELDHPYLKEQREFNIKSDTVNKLTPSESVDYKFNIGDSGQAKEMLKKGLLTEKEYHDMKASVQKKKFQNKGYVFITYTHADDARKAMIYYASADELGLKLLVSTKKGIDHKDLDTLYRMNQMKNDSKLVDEFDQLAQAKKELQTFEDKIDEDLPSLKKLREFQESARSALDNGSRDRSHPSHKRTQDEEEALNKKIKKMEKENPQTDYTELFDTKRAEESRKMQHKKAYASYKAFEFLKAGIKPAAETAEPQSTKSGSKYEAYKFPPLEQTVAKFLTKDDRPRVLDTGDRYTKPGRKYDYTEEDFIEMYYGKDMARVPSMIKEENPIFGYNESFKNRYPIDKYAQYPRIKEQLDTVEAQYEPALEEFSKDKLLENFMKQLDPETYPYGIDEQHPTNPKKTKMQVLGEKTQQLFDRYPDGEIDGKDVAQTRVNLLKEFNPHKKERSVYTERLGSQKFKVFKKHRQGLKFVKNTEEGFATRNDRPGPEHQYNKQKKSDYQEGTYVEQEPVSVKSNNIQDEGTKIQEELSDVNKDFIYKVKRFQDLGYEEDLQTQSLHYKQLKNLAGGNTKLLNEQMDALKDQKHMAVDNKLGGEYYERVLNEQDKINGNKSVRDTNVQGQQNLKQFSGYNQEADGEKSEREDEDIYSYYKKKMQEYEVEESEWQKNKSNVEVEETAGHWQEKIDNLRGQMKESPGFKEYYDAKQIGQHPFESDEYTQRNQKDLDEEQKQKYLEEKQSAELYTRELLGRMYGEKISPRQFEMLTNMKVTPEQQLALQKDHDYNQFLSSKSLLSLVAEKKESLRRQNVIEGKWTEAESHQRIEEHEQWIHSQIPTPREQAYIDAYREEFEEAIKNVQNPESLLEREYHFEEGMGKSVQEHVDELKRDIPDICVELRRDRDGYAIIKTSLKQTYKYDLDTIMNYDHDKQMTNVKRGLNELMKLILPSKNVNGQVELDREALEKGLHIMQEMKKQQGSERYDLTDESKQGLTKLIKDNILGRITPEQFAKQYIELSERAQFDKSKVLPPLNIFRDGQIDQEQMIDEHWEDKELMMKELYIQMVMRIRAHINLKERTPNDFVKPKKSEVHLFQQMTTSLEHGSRRLEQQMEEMGGEEGSMDKEAYKKIRDEVRRRREAKERMIRQGYPELKPYLHL